MIGLLIFGLALRIGAVLYFADFTDPLTWEYGGIARHVAEGRGFIATSWLGTEEPTAQMAPLYVFLLAGALKSLGPLSYAAVQLLQALLSGLLSLLLYRLAADLFDRRIALATLALAAVYPPFIYFPKQISPAILAALAAVAVAICVVRLAHRGTIRNAMLCGLAAGLAGLTEPFALLPAAGLVLVRLRSFKAAAGGLALLVAALIVLPWTARNYLVFDTFVPARSVSGLALWVGNNPLATGHEYTQTGDFLITLIDPDLFRSIQHLNEAQRDAALGRQALEWIVQNPTRFLELTGWRVFYFWWSSPNYEFDPGWTGTEPRYLYTLQMVLHVPILVLAAIGGWQALRKNRAAALALVLWLVSITLPYAISVASFRRYRLPAEPALVILAAVGIVGVLEWWYRREQQAAAASAAPVSIRVGKQ